MKELKARFRKVICREENLFHTVTLFQANVELVRMMLEETRDLNRAKSFI